MPPFNVQLPVPANNMSSPLPVVATRLLAVESLFHAYTEIPAVDPSPFNVEFPLPATNKAGFAGL